MTLIRPARYSRAAIKTTRPPPRMKLAPFVGSRCAAMAPLTLTAQHHSYHSHGVTLGSGRKGDSTGERGDRLEPLSRTLPANVGANRDHDPRARLCCLSRPAVSRDQASGCELKKRGARLLSMSVLYGDQGIEHRLRDSGAKVLVTDSANRARVPEGLAEMVFVIDSPEARGERSPGDFDLMAELGRASDRYEPADTAADDPAQLYYSSGTTGLPKGILHAHRYLLPTRSSSSATTSMTASSFTAGRVGLGRRHMPAARAVA